MPGLGVYAIGRMQMNILQSIWTTLKNQPKSIDFQLGFLALRPDPPFESWHPAAEGSSVNRAQPNAPLGVTGPPPRPGTMPGLGVYAIGRMQMNIFQLIYTTHQKINPNPLIFHLDFWRFGPILPLNLGTRQRGEIQLVAHSHIYIYTHM